MSEFKESKDFEIKIANRLISGILTLLFSILFAFVFVEERQRGLTIIMAILLAICLIWYAYSRFLSSGSKQRMKTEYTDTKRIILILTTIIIISTIVSYSIRSRISTILALLFIVIIVIYEIIDYVESQRVEETDNKKSELKKVDKIESNNVDMR